MTYNEPKNQAETRILDILTVVSKNSSIHHNALKKIIVEDKHLMAKRTFDKLTKEMRSRGTLGTVSMNDNKIHYIVPQLFSQGNVNFENEFEVFIQSFEMNIKKMKKDYKKVPLQGKQGLMIGALSNIFSGIVGITLIKSISEPSIESLSKQERRLRKCVKDCIDIIMHDKDANLVIQVVNDSILSSFTTTQFLQLLKMKQ